MFYNNDEEKTEDNFLLKIEDKIQMRSLLPKAINEFGERLISKMRFHELWLKIIWRKDYVNHEKFL